MTLAPLIFQVYRARAKPSEAPKQEGSHNPLTLPCLLDVRYEVHRHHKDALGIRSFDGGLGKRFAGQ